MQRKKDEDDIEEKRKNESKVKIFIAEKVT